MSEYNTQKEEAVLLFWFVPASASRGRCRGRTNRSLVSEIRLGITGDILEQTAINPQLNGLRLCASTKVSEMGGKGPEMFRFIPQRSHADGVRLWVVEVATSRLGILVMDFT